MEKLKTGVEQRAARESLKLMTENVMKFKLPDTFKYKIASFNKQKKQFTEEQCSYIDGLYEKYMGYGGFPSVKVKHDFKKKR